MEEFVREGIRYPKVRVQLSGEDGNGFMIVARVRKALRKAGVKEAELDEFVAEATGGDYSDLIGTVSNWVDAR